MTKALKVEKEKYTSYGGDEEPQQEIEEDDDVMQPF